MKRCLNMYLFVFNYFIQVYPQKFATWLFNDYFSAAILSFSMFSINTGNISKATIYLLHTKIKILHRELQPFPGGKRFDGIPAFATSSTRSAVRYKYIFEQRLADTHYHTYMLEIVSSYPSLLIFSMSIERCSSPLPETLKTSVPSKLKMISAGNAKKLLLPHAYFICLEPFRTNAFDPFVLKKQGSFLGWFSLRMGTAPQISPAKEET